MPAGQRITLVAAGAGAGIAATFNTPIGGVMFADRADDARGQRRHLSAGGDRDRHRDLRRPLVLRRRSRPSPCRRCAAAGDAERRLDAAAVTRLLGALIGVAAAGFIRGLHLGRGCLRRIRCRYLRHMLGMLLVGVLMYVLFRSFGHYYVDGVGYATIQAILTGGRSRLSGCWLLLFALQAAGDVAQPRVGLVGRHLFAVAVHGRDARRRLRGAAQRCWPADADSSVPAFAMVGMGAMVGGGTGAVMTAVTMIFEMTLDYDIVMPMIVAVADERRRAPGAVAREHLHAEAGPPRPGHPQGAARQHVPGAPRA